MWKYLVLLILLVVIGLVLYKLRQPLIATITGGYNKEPKYAMASLGKGVFAYAVIKSNIVDLDEPLYKYLTIAEHDPRHKQITARQILSHTSGLHNRSSDKDIHFDPGTDYKYSGNGYTYLQKVIESITKQPIEEFMKKHVFEPFDLKNSTYGEANVIQGRNSEGNPIPIRKSSPNVRHTFKSTESDYIKFLNNISDVDYKIMSTPVYSMSDTIKAGLGFGIDYKNGKKYLFQHGSNPGYKHFVYWRPNDIFLNLTNSDNGFEKLFQYPKLFASLKFIKIFPTIKIRKIKKSDIKFTRPITDYYQRLLGNEPLNESDAKYWKMVDNSSLVALVNNQIVGVSIYDTKKDTLNLITVDPKYQGLSVGFNLLRDTLKLLRSPTLKVKKKHPKANVLPLYYARFGFVKTKETKEYIEMTMWYSYFEKKHNLKIIKELQSGGNGTVYLVKRNTRKLILKMERLDVWGKPLTSEYNRQVDFDKIAQKYPDKFMTLVDHGLIKNCSYVHPWTYDKQYKASGDRRRRFDRKNSQTTCYWLLYEPFLDGTLGSVEEKIRTNKVLWNDFLDQIFETFNILKKHGYSQNDFNPGNFMFKKIKNKYRWYLIDYGQIWHEKYPESQLDRDLKKCDGNRRNNDIRNFIEAYSPVRSYINKHGLINQQIPFDDALKNAKGTDEFKQLKSFGLNDRNTLRLLSSIYPRKWLVITGVDNTKPWNYLPIPFSKIELLIK